MWRSGVAGWQEACEPASSELDKSSVLDESSVLDASNVLDAGHCESSLMRATSLMQGVVANPRRTQDTANQNQGMLSSNRKPVLSKCRPSFIRPRKPRMLTDLTWE